MATSARTLPPPMNRGAYVLLLLFNLHDGAPSCCSYSGFTRSRRSCCLSVTDVAQSRKPVFSAADLCRQHWVATATQMDYDTSTRSVTPSLTTLTFRLVPGKMSACASLETAFAQIPTSNAYGCASRISTYTHAYIYITATRRQQRNSTNQSSPTHRRYPSLFREWNPGRTKYTGTTYACLKGAF